MTVTAYEMVPILQHRETSNENNATSGRGLYVRDLDQIIYDSVRDRMYRELKTSLSYKAYRAARLTGGAIILVTPLAGFIFGIVWIFTKQNFDDSDRQIVTLAMILPLLISGIACSLFLQINKNTLPRILIDRRARAYVDGIQDNVIESQDIERRLVAALSRENIVLMDEKQFAAALRVAWDVIQNEFNMEDLEPGQKEAFTKVGIIRNMNSTDIVELLYDPTFIEDLKRTPYVAEVVLNYLSEGYAEGERGRVRIDALREQIRPGIGIGDTYAGDIHDEVCLEVGVPCDSDSDDGVPIAPVSIYEQPRDSNTDASWRLRFKNGEYADDIPKSVLTAKCRFFSSSFLANKETIDLSYQSKQDFDLLMRLLSGEHEVIDSDNIASILDIASYLQADEAIFSCMQYLSDRITEIDLSQATKIHQTALQPQSEADRANFAELQLSLQLLFVEKIFGADSPQWVLKNVKVFCELFGMQFCNIGIEIAIFTKLEQTLASRDVVDRYTIGKYFMLIDVLPKPLQEKLRVLADAAIPSVLNRSAAACWRYACCQNLLPYKKAIASYCLSDKGENAFLVMRKEMNWVSIPKEFLSLAEEACEKASAASSST